MSVNYPRVYTTLGSYQVITFDLGPRLAEGVTLTGTPSVVDANGGTELSISSSQVNSVGDSAEGVEVGKAVQFLVSTSSTEQVTYTLKITCATDQTPAETLVDKLMITFLE
jgi:ribosomal protein S1